MTASEYVGIFGYGSLVNRLTRGEDLISELVRIRNWRRSWRHCVATENGNVCALTMIPDTEAEVAGVVVAERRDELARLDAREIGYQRVPLTLSARVAPISNAPADRECFTYVSSPTALRPGSREFPIWRSYLECVLAGFLDLGGDAAARDFIATTDGWDVPMLDDRSAPKYMRAIRLPPNIQREVDVLIGSHGLDRSQFEDMNLLKSRAPKLGEAEEFG